MNIRRVADLGNAFAFALVLVMLGVGERFIDEFITRRVL